MEFAVQSAIFRCIAGLIELVLGSQRIDVIPDVMVLRNDAVVVQLSKILVDIGRAPFILFCILGAEGAGIVGGAARSAAK